MIKKIGVSNIALVFVEILMLLFIGFFDKFYKLCERVELIIGVPANLVFCGTGIFIAAVSFIIPIAILISDSKSKGNRKCIQTQDSECTRTT